MIKYFLIANNTLIESDSPASPIVLYLNPDASEKSVLTSECQLDEHTLSSALDPDEISRVEFTDDRTLLIWKRPKNYSGEEAFLFNVTSVGLFLIKERLILVVTEDIVLTSPSVRQMVRLVTPVDVLLNFLYITIHHYLEHLKVMKMISRELHLKINTSMENRHLIQMFNLSESLVYYANAINSNHAVLTKLRNSAEKMNLPAPTIEFLDDLIIENNQCFKQAEIYSTVFSGLMDARGNLVNNNMNVLLKNLTVINVIFLPLNLLASIGGMSEFSMMTHGIDWRISYSLFFIGMLMIGWLTFLLLGKINFANSGLKRRKQRP
ncbi:MAG: magnesium transporter CorA family protein [Bacteroidota bacterium]